MSKDNKEGESPVNGELSLETIAEGNYCGLKSRWHDIIKTRADLEQAWNRFDFGILMPYVHFGKEMVFGICLGEKTSGGYAVKIEKVIDHDEYIEFCINESGPPEGVAVSMVLTNPYHIVKMKRLDKMPVIKFKNRVGDPFYELYGSYNPCP